MDIVYLGHSSFLIKAGYEIIIDPFLKNNPSRNKKENVPISPDFILITHAHGDHLGDAVEIASKKSDAKVVCIYEIAQYLSSKGVKNIHSMNIGGKLNTDFGFIKMVSAVHSSSIVENKDIIYGGLAAGFIMNIDGKIVYHAGDTALFSEMKLFGEMFEIDLALLPIGGNFTMDLEDAVLALNWLRPKAVIPMHYNTWPVIDADADQFLKEAGKLNITGVKLNINENYRL